MSIIKKTAVSLLWSDSTTKSCLSYYNPIFPCFIDHQGALLYWIPTPERLFIVFVSATAYYSSILGRDQLVLDLLL